VYLTYLSFTSYCCWTNAEWTGSFNGSYSEVNVQHQSVHEILASMTSTTLNWIHVIPKHVITSVQSNSQNKIICFNSDWTAFSKQCLNSWHRLYKHLSAIKWRKQTSAMRKVQLERWVHAWMECLWGRRPSYDAACVAPACCVASVPVHPLISPRTQLETPPFACSLITPAAHSTRQRRDMCILRSCVL